MTGGTRRSAGAAVLGRWAASDGLLGWADCGLAGSAGCSRGIRPTLYVRVLQIFE
jgi:hypothetical protein